MAKEANFNQWKIEQYGLPWAGSGEMGAGSGEHDGW